MSLVQSAQAGNSSAGATSISLAAPATAGNLLISVCGDNEADASNDVHPTDFTILGYFSNSFGDGRAVSVGYKPAVGGEQSYSSLTGACWNLMEFSGYGSTSLGFEGSSWRNDTTPPVPTLAGLSGDGLVLIARMKQPATPNPGPETCTGFSVAADTGYAGAGSRFRLTTWYVEAAPLASSYGGFDLSGSTDGSEDGTAVIFGFAAAAAPPAGGSRRRSFGVIIG